MTYSLTGISNLGTVISEESNKDAQLFSEQRIVIKSAPHQHVFTQAYVPTNDGILGERHGDSCILNGWQDVRPP